MFCFFFIASFFDTTPNHLFFGSEDGGRSSVAFGKRNEMGTVDGDAMGVGSGVASVIEKTSSIRTRFTTQQRRLDHVLLEK